METNIQVINGEVQVTETIINVYTYTLNDLQTRIDKKNEEIIVIQSQLDTAKSDLVDFQSKLNLLS